jgi:hypothetical protein
MGQGTTHVSVPISIDARGANAAGIARVHQQLAELNHCTGTIVKTVTQARKTQAVQRGNGEAAYGSLLF